MIYELSVSDIIIFNNTVTNKPYREYVQHQLTFSQGNAHNIRTRKPTSSLQFNQSVSYRKSVANLSATSTLFFDQQVAKQAIEVSVLSGLSLSQTVRRPFWEQLTQTLNLGNGVVGNSGKGVQSLINLQQTIAVNMVRNRSITSPLTLVNGVVGFLCDPNYNQLNPTITTNSLVKFSFGVSERYFHKPEFGDKYGDNSTRINRRSRGGDLLISRQSYWPTTKTFDLKFTYLKQEDVDWFLWFFKHTLGKKINYLNYNNILWEGFIMNPQSEATQVGRANFEINIQFDGTQV